MRASWGIPALWCALLASSLLGCGSVDKPQGLEARIDKVLGKMTLEEKVDQMHGTSIVTVDGLFETPENTRLGIPSFRMIDGPRGVRVGTATTFPVGMARGATWDPELEKQIGEAMGQELAAKGGNVLLAPTINVLRHPRWGRAQETYGEDPFHIGEMGAAFIEGAQKWVIANAKHFVANSIEDVRFTVDVTIDERTLREVYMPQFKKAVEEAHVGSVMSAYNSVNGHYCSENAHNLRDVLDGDWGFDGFVVSDWTLGTHSTVPAAKAGLDVEMPAPAYFGDKLLQAVEGGQVPESVIDDAVRRILRIKFRFHLDKPKKPPLSVVEDDTHKALAQKAEEEAIVLLKNDAGALPLDRQKIKRLAVVGELADTVNLGDHGSSNSVPASAVTPLAGIKSQAQGVAIDAVKTSTPSAANLATIAADDAAVVVVGLTYKDEGEDIPGGPGGDRTTMQLSAAHQALIQAVAAQNPRTIVVMEGGSAITVHDWVSQVPALLMAWYPGEEGGMAIARVLFGDVSPSGHLPVTIPIDESQLPPFVNDQNAVTYGYLHGYRWVDDKNETPEFSFGFGLSYTSFKLAKLQLDSPSVAPDGTLEASVDVTNTGSRAGAEVVQLYVSYPGSKVQRAPRTLEAFQRVELQPGETQTVKLGVKAADFRYWDTQSSSWKLEQLQYKLEVGTSSRDLPLSTNFSVSP